VLLTSAPTRAAASLMLSKLTSGLGVSRKLGLH
jgi:hypothetical protein